MIFSYLFFESYNRVSQVYQVFLGLLHSDTVEIC